MEGFSLLKQNIQDYNGNSKRHQKRLEIVRLVLAGPDPDFVADDPEGKEVLEELAGFYQSLPASVQKDIAILKLPMASRKQNALIVNALQRSSTIVVQNSIQEGFGLTATEAMWKKVPVLVSNACGLRQQVRDGMDGRMVQQAEDVKEIASVLNEMLCDYKCREVWGYNAQKHAIDKFMIFAQVEAWLNLLDGLVSRN